MMTGHLFLSLFLLISACAPVIQPLEATPVVSSPTPEPSPAPLTPTPLPTISLDYAVQTTAYVLPSAVNIREAPVVRDGTQVPGEPLNLYLYIGDAVTILECRGDWCQVETTIAERKVVGWVYRGCLSSVAGPKLCEAR